MDVRKIFRRLVTNEFMPYHDYGTTHRFKTVFYKSAFSYKCCPCAFEHEFLLYIDGDGHIQEKMYQKLEQSIVDGKCPHVDLATSEFIHESSTSSLHIALAVGTEEVVNDNLERMIYSSCGLFQLKLLDIAFMKTKLESFEGLVHCHTLPPFGKNQAENWVQRHLKCIQGGHDKVKVICCDSSDNLDCFTIKELSVFELICGRTNVIILEHILQNSYFIIDELFRAFNYIMEHEQKILEDCFLDFVKSEEVYHFVVEYFIEAAIVYNRTGSLEKIICMFTENQQRVLQMIGKQALSRLSYLTKILKRDRCKGILERYRAFSSQNLSGRNQVSELLYMLKRFGKSCKNEVLTALPQVKHFQEECINYVDRNLITLNIVNTSLVQDILSLGVDIFDGDIQPEKSWFSRLLQLLNYYDEHVADLIRTLIGANPDLDQQVGVIELAFLQDEVMYKMEENRNTYGNPRSLTGAYVTDIKEHGVFGLDDLHFAINFAGPLLLECGFPVTMEQLEKALDKNLHPLEHKYIKNNIHGRLEGRKCLLIACRETLRKNFRGLKLHRFLEYSKCPKKIKDFVLMKALVQPSQRKC